MKKLKLNCNYLSNILSFFLLLIFISKPILSNEITFEIKGNKFTDSNVILSLLQDVPKNINEEYSNEIIKTLNKSSLFVEVKVRFTNNKYIIEVEEFPSINKL